MDVTSIYLGEFEFNNCLFFFFFWSTLSGHSDVVFELKKVVFLCLIEAKQENKK